MKTIIQQNNRYLLDRIIGKQNPKKIDVTPLCLHHDFDRPIADVIYNFSNN